MLFLGLSVSAAARPTSSVPARESSRHKHRAETFKSIMESTWVMPVLATNVTTVGATTADKHNTKNNEANNCNNLNERKYKLASPYPFTPKS